MKHLQIIKGDTSNNTNNNSNSLVRKITTLRADL